nr:3D domain-containing protein [uncultured Bacillus sp.]
MILLSTTIMANAETSQAASNKLQQNAEVINQKQVEKDNITIELQNLKDELSSIENEVTKNKENMAATEKDITKMKALIEEKKEEIVVLEDKVLVRKEVMEDRLISLQHTDTANLFIELLVNSKNIDDFIQRATAVSTLINADKELLQQQKDDLKKIEEEKAVIDEQEEKLDEQYQTLASTQAALEQNLQKRQEMVSAVQTKYNTVVNELALAEKEKAAIQADLAQAQARITTERQEAQARFNQVQHLPADANTYPKSANELYVTATAYSHEDSSSGMTALGYNIKANPNMKLIAVDPSVIPLGSRVWVEGYGEAIAGDTGGAIKGHKIDVLMPSGADARAWGRKTVKVIILN